MLLAGPAPRRRAPTNAGRPVDLVHFDLADRRGRDRLLAQCATPASRHGDVGSGGPSNDPRRGTAAETEDARNDEGGSSGRRDGHEARTLLATSLLRTRRGPAVGSARASARYRFEFDPALKLISTPDQKTRLSSVAAFEINSKTTGLFQILFCAIFYILFYVLLCALVHIPVFHSMFY